MKNNLIIFSNNKVNNFLIEFLSTYQLTFLKLEEIDYTEEFTKAKIIIINNNKDCDKINFEKLNANYLILSNLTNKNFNIKNSYQLLKTPVSANNIKNKIENFFQNLKINFHDISIKNEILTNLKNNSFCYLTKIELEILTCLVKEKETSKKFIRENILKIKSNIETNSLESHLTRIRKKLTEIQTGVKIKTRDEKLIITI